MIHSPTLQNNLYICQ